MDPVRLASPHVWLVRTCALDKIRSSQICDTGSVFPWPEVTCFLLAEVMVSAGRLPALALTDEGPGWDGAAPRQLHTRGSPASPCGRGAAPCPAQAVLWLPEEETVCIPSAAGDVPSAGPEQLVHSFWACFLCGFLSVDCVQGTVLSA